VDQKSRAGFDSSKAIKPINRSAALCVEACPYQATHYWERRFAKKGPPKEGPDKK
jgi:hypothetical protein